MIFEHPNNKKFVFKDDLNKIPEIQEVSLGSLAPAINGRVSNVISVMQKGKVVKINVDARSGDTAFLNVYNIKLLAGRNIMVSDTV